MPIYEYRRPDGTTFEIVQSFSDDALTKDPETGVKVERVFHAPAIHFKGKGFHNTDYGTRNRNREKAAESAAASESSSSSDSSSSGASDSSSSSGDSSSTKSEAPKKSEPAAKPESKKPEKNKAA